MINHIRIALALLLLSTPAWAYKKGGVPITPPFSADYNVDYNLDFPGGF